MFEAEDQVMEILRKRNIEITTTLPCDRAKNLCSLLDSGEGIRNIIFNKEEDCVGTSAGVYLAGGRPAMVIQSSGLGNSLNAILSLSSTYKLPLPIIASWRGIYNEKIAAQIPFNEKIPKALEAWEIPYKIIEDSGDLDLITDVIDGAYEKNCPYVALISPKAWESCGNEVIGNDFPDRDKRSSLKYNKEIRNGEMTRYEAIEVISRYLDNEAVISNIGIPSKELYNIHDRDLNFYMLGSYSQASPIGFGMALKTKRDVIVIDGDGSISATCILPTIAKESPENLTIICLDNGAFGSTGNQRTYAYSDMDIEL
ncbi:MAG: sulfopyruvate decarboxylase subunit alpha, partial [Halobacteriota archaeon]|nr:sulfopyruvate decarboxylase subunit alpha [Halobacteriota archaeon]